MNLMRAVILSTAAIAASGWAAPPLPLPADSLYQAPIAFTDAQARPLAWSDKRGHPQLVSMFYTSCTFVCPMLIDGIQVIRQSLAPDERAQIGVTLITLDPKRDTPKVLARMQKERDLDPGSFTLVQPRSADVRTVAGLLGVRYRVLADGDFNHTTVLVLLDGEGRIIARTEHVAGSPDLQFLAAVHRVIAASAKRSQD